ncbi:hypothetical protein [Marinobacter sp.]|uniref:hypothetical protein n=1 Tax=Marinobacter sp. TaxID=50741 RepID=UPI0019B6C454|nr:hypothetical protein [Marinobacter sp.]MBD3657192.1 hypothetical protein [Marinobacter sp.]
MPQLVITSCFRALLLWAVVMSAAALGSTRPMELPDRHTPMPETPELVISSLTEGVRRDQTNPD